MLPHVLAVGAHPDDVVLGAGGVLTKLAAAGHRVTFLCLTSGELAGSPLDREGEELEAARRLDGTAVFGHLEDGNVTQRDAIRLISSYVDRLLPTIVFAHDPEDTHQDHVNVGRAAAVACRVVHNLFYYEGPSTVAFRPNSVVEIDDVWQAKQNAINAYASQLDVRPLLSWARAAADFRAWPRHVGSPCESFRIAHAEFALLGAAQVKNLDLGLVEALA